MQRSSQYIRNPDFIFRKIVEDMILVPIKQDVADLNCIYTLNEVGAFLWEQLAEPSTPAALEQAVINAYDAPHEQVAADIAQFIDDLLIFGAINEVEG